ncbi:MAG: D-alanyl-D-alanine carboxypeptidase/D-alanyl-D-alanine-endopeptidase [Burkholderiales bacterium]
MLKNYYIIALLWSFAAAAAEPLPPGVVKAFQQADIPLSAVGIYVRELDAAEHAIAHRADQPMNPASVMKLVTTYAALELLTPGYTWKTEAYALAMNGDGVSGDLYLKGYGDPSLTLEDFWLLLRALKQRGVRTIRGDLVLDQSYFELPNIDPNGFDNQGYRAYNTNPHAMLVSFKAVSARFIPMPNGSLRVVLDPDLAQIKLKNQVNIRPGLCPNNWRDSISKDVQNGPRTAVIELKGSFYADCGEKSLQFNLLSNPDFIAALFKQLWTEMGGTWLGNVREGTIKEGERPLLSWESRSLPEAVRDMNKWSNNVMARALLLTIGAERLGSPGTPAKGAQAISTWLSTKGLEMPELVLENGAGLSRKERISPKSLGDLLVSASNSPIMPELMASLPIAGVDGTMKKRLKNNEMTGRAHIKTGTLEGVKAIAGYVLARSGKRLAVVCLINHANAASGDVAQDALLQWAYQKF